MRIKMDMRANLASEGTREHGVAELGSVHPHVQHDRGGQLVRRRGLAVVLHRLHHVNAVPAARLHGPVTFHV